MKRRDAFCILLGLLIGYTLSANRVTTTTVTEDCPPCEPRHILMTGDLHVMVSHETGQTWVDVRADRFDDFDNDGDVDLYDWALGEIDYRWGCPVDWARMARAMTGPKRLEE